MSSVPPEAGPAERAGAVTSGDLAALLTPAAGGEGPDLHDALRALLEGVSRALGAPIALLSRAGAEWRFEAESVVDSGSAAPRFVEPPAVGRSGADTELTDTAGSAWTGFVAGTSGRREWMLIVPGRAERWRETPGLNDLMDRFARNLEAVVHQDEERQFGELHRRLYAFVRRLTRAADVTQTHACILRTLANEVRAKTGALAVFAEGDQALTIVATHGYPRAIVEHIRIAPGEGIIGEAFANGRATLGRSGRIGPRRYRYRTDSYIAVPLRAFGRPAAVVTLTDRVDGQPFDDRDFTAVRLLAAPAALAIARHRVSESLDELTRAATVDPVTGLFNRRYFETRIEAEVQRARRQQQDLALLMVDIDDFKRINDTFGHLEGDRALRDVADLLRRGVRIFDVCARYGGEEFAIVMPGATRQMAVQVAERIRQGVYDRSRVAPLPMTVSVGVGFLGVDQSQEDLIASADRALISAKRAGKNIVKTS
jgi:diguanylate cyclase (GGDEF)-like protein